MIQSNNTELSKAAGRNLDFAEFKPELLCPAGSPAAFDAAIEAGADAIYIGGSEFNARINAKNFNDEEMRSAIERAHAYGVKVYLAANTLIYDREMKSFMGAAEKAYLYGADALIVADIGAASLIKRYMPELELHASTQLSGHGVDAARRLAEAGFSRMVCAREMSADDIRRFTENSPIEAEVFVHGALCVCHSGQCLFSSLVGKRSGNRGECAQPCRLPYKTESGNGYPLSLKDLCLAEHVTELIDMGVASFKIEGRMKSPEYVRDVASIWRRLIDERRDATREEMEALEKIFSRGGFTDGYYKRVIGIQMMGVRSDENKRDTRELIPFEGITRKIGVELEARIEKGKPMSLTVLPQNITVTGDIPEEAINAPTDAVTVERCLRKLGGTPYEAKRVEIKIDSGLMIPISKLNALRRAAVDAIAQRLSPKREGARADVEVSGSKGVRKNTRSAVFYNPEAITDKAREYFDIIYTPLLGHNGRSNGVILPAVVFDSEREDVLVLLRRACALGADHALVGNIGHLDLVLKAGLIPHGDMRLNVTNDASMAYCESLGFEDVILSPELSMSAMRDIGGASAATVYGRVPLMVTEKCVGMELGGCNECQNGKTELVDRRNVSFPVRREYKHRSLIFNSVPIFMGDKKSELDKAKLSMRHFIFLDETPEEVDEIINSYENQLPYDKPFRRMN